MTEPAYPLEQSWPAQGHWTYADYLRLPDDGQRHEVIRGNLYVSPAPDFVHQYIVSRLCWLLTSVVVENDLGLILVAPFDVLLPQRIADPVQPDILFFKKGNEPRPGDKSFSGVPDLVVEVLSPSTRRLDEKVKLSAYRDAGVPELWFADPKPRTLLVHRLDKSARTYVEEARRGPGETVASVSFPGLQIKVSTIFPHQS
jgi:Uma2 family endonuclease